MCWGLKLIEKNEHEAVLVSSALFAIQAGCPKLNSYSPSGKKKPIESVKTLTWDDSKEMQTKVKNDPENMEM